ncbi:MAG TPA: ABC transporter permease subunit [Candidatus Limnocylindrales bacterium]|nr:ABC transporter permease subunit [Candidatus Limnocylindrales bacterium]
MDGHQGSTAAVAVSGRRSGSDPDLAPGLPGSGRVARLGSGALAAIALLFLGLPVAALLARALFSGALRDAPAGALVDALILSLATSLVSVVVIVLLGSPLAWVLARRTFRGKAIAETLVDLPIVLPPTVAGLALLLAFGRRGVTAPALELAGLSIPFTTLAVVVAQVFVSAPFYIRAARAGLQSVDRELEEAAAVDGAAGDQVLRRITIPLAAPALGEFGATIMFAGSIAGRTRTLPLLVYAEFQDTLDAAVVAASVLVMAAIGVLVAVRLTHWRSVLPA